MRKAWVFGKSLLGGAMALSVLLTRVGRAESEQPPLSPDHSVKVTLFADAPQIVTPIGAAIDTKGRLFVIESNTHFPPKTYEGAPSDQIRVFSDIGGEKASHVSTYFEGMKLLMNLAADSDGSLVVSSRNEVFRLRPSENPETAGEKVSLLKLDTKSVYPHNGLHGLAVDKDRNIYVGLGENFGGEWTITGTDGRKLTDDKGSGSIFRVDSEGKGLVRLARGFWNPFGLGMDPAGQVWAVDNDPDGRPPCRLIPVLAGADYGFEFRFGRTGLHPLQAWDGELPGTTGMVAGVGEAPVALLWRKGKLLVSSWRDHVVQSFTLTAKGAGYTAEVTPLITGDEHFRPTGMALAADGSLFVMDWASGSYSVNGKGRIWKAVFADEPAGKEVSTLSAAAERAVYLRRSQNVQELLGALDDPDPVMGQAAECGLSRLAESESVDFKSLTTPRQRIGLLTALLTRNAPMTTNVKLALSDSDDRVRQMAVRCIAEQKISEVRAELAKSLETAAMSPRLLAMTIAALNLLDGDGSAKVDSSKVVGVLMGRINSPQATDQTKAIAMSMLQASHPPLPAEQVQALVKSATPALQLQAVRYLIADTGPERFGLLEQVASDGKADPQLRAEALLGLADDAANRTDLLLKLAADPNRDVGREALRSLRPVGTKLTSEQQSVLAKVAEQDPSSADLVHRATGQLPGNRPGDSDIDAWQKIVGAGDGNAEAGRRIFFHPAGPGCYKCHMIEGRGRAIGPDLTMIGHSQTRQHVLESILQPSKEIAPLFVQWSIRTKSGEQIDGMLLRRDGQETEVYVDSSGKETKVAEPNVIDRRMRKESLMPNGLAAGMTDQELRDLIAFLMEKR